MNTMEVQEEEITIQNSEDGDIVIQNENDNIITINVSRNVSRETSSSTAKKTKLAKLTNVSKLVAH